MSKANKLIQIVLHLLMGRYGRRGSHQGLLSDRTVETKIVGAAAMIGGLSVVVHLVAMAKELFVAAWFGTGDALDAFLMAMVVPSFIINVVAGSFHSALIPTYVQVREGEDLEVTQSLFSSVMKYCIVLLLMIGGLVIFLSPSILPVLAAGFNAEKLALTQNILYWLLPVVAIQGVITVWSTVLNAGRRFALPAIAPAFLPLAIIGVLILGGRGLGIFSLVVGTIIGFAIQAVLLGLGLRRQGLSVWPQWRKSSPHVRTVMDQYGHIVVGAFLMCSTNLVDQSMAATLQSGSVAVLSYGSRLVNTGLGLTATSIATAAFPYFSRQVALKDMAALRQNLHGYLRMIFLVTIPMVVIIYAFSEPIIGLLYERGAFSSQDTRLVAQFQSLFVLQIPFYIGGVLLVRVISSLRANRIVMWASGLSLFIKIVLNYFFIQSLGVTGIALSTSLMFLGSFVFMYYFAGSFLNERLEKGSHVNESE